MKFDADGALLILGLLLPPGATDNAYLVLGVVALSLFIQFPEIRKIVSEFRELARWLR